MLSVLFLKAPTYETSQLVSQHNPSAYYYSFEYEGRNSLFEYNFPSNAPPVPHGMNLIFISRFRKNLLLLQILFFDQGVCHGDEMIYLFVFPFPSLPPGLNRSETELSMKMLQVWTNFVILG